MPDTVLSAGATIVNKRGKCLPSHTLYSSWGRKINTIMSGDKAGSGGKNALAGCYLIYSSPESSGRKMLESGLKGVRSTPYGHLVPYICSLQRQELVLRIWNGTCLVDSENSRMAQVAEKEWGKGNLVVAGGRQIPELRF